MMILEHLNDWMLIENLVGWKQHESFSLLTKIWDFQLLVSR